MNRLFKSVTKFCQFHLSTGIRRIDESGYISLCVDVYVVAWVFLGCGFGD